MQRCPQCAAPARHAFDTPDVNRRIGTERFSYSRCATCGVVFLANPPADIGRYYPQEYYTIASTLEELAAWGSAERYKLDIVRRYASRGRLIEVGPASGAFAYLAKSAGFEVTVIEMDERCARYLAGEAGLDVIHSADEAKALAGAPQADVIAMWHVIEHLVDPWGMLEAAAERLRPGGILVIAAPNPLAWQFRLFGGRWTHVDAPRHLWLIPASVIVARGERLGLKPKLATTRDPGSLSWNRFGWEYSLANGCGLARRAAFHLTRVFSRLGRPVEEREGQGAAYTVVLQKAA